MTVVEMETSVPVGGFTSAVSTELADYSLKALNRFLDTYQVLTEQWDVHHINWELLGPELVIELRRRSDTPSGRLSMPNRRASLPFESDRPNEHLLPLLTDALRREPYNHPLDLVRRLYARASRYAEMGEYEAAIESLQTSAERLTFALHKMLLVESGHVTSEIERLMPAHFSTAFKALPQVLGGNWNTSGDSPTARYWSNLYLVRNRITHAGITPLRDEVPAAFDAYNGLWAHVHEQALKRRTQMPRTTLTIHGGVGLKKAGALDRRMRDFIAQIEARGESFNYWLPIDQRQQ